jgi:hypothetical protein
MNSTIIPLTALTCTFVECECGNEMPASMDKCGDCINEESNVIGMGQRAFVRTRRSFQYGN